VNRETPFPKWVPATVARKARALGEDEAIEALRASGVTVPP
jgi:hypothetical protein